MLKTVSAICQNVMSIQNVLSIHLSKCITYQGLGILRILHIIFNDLQNRCIGFIDKETETHIR